ncbi:hypothetical protein BGZ94_009254 [Podila epigama]|nr:hypothetical protein BGZ94_009254 [Podila epigama]
MSFGGYNPAGSSDLPFTTTGGTLPTATTMRSRTGSFSSVHSNQGTQQNPYTSQPGTPTTPGRGIGAAGGSDGYFSGPPSAYGTTASYNDNYGSNPPSPGYHASNTSHSSHPHNHHHPHAGYSATTTRNGGNNGYSSGYDSPTGVNYAPKDLNGFPIQQQQKPSQPPHRQRRHQHAHHHQRTHSNASETSLNIDTGFTSGAYSPGPASLSSAGSSRRNSISDAAAASGGFFSAQKSTFRPRHRYRDADHDDHDDDDDDDDDDDKSYGYGGLNSFSSKTSSRRLRTRKSNGVGVFGHSNKKGLSGKRSGSNDWDLLLPSTDAFDDDEDEDQFEGMTESERWKKKQLSRKGWNNPRVQIMILVVLVSIAALIRMWKLAIPASVVFDEQHFGGFTVDYLKGEFFVDVHPPLGKLLYAAVAYMLRFDGKFNFVLGKLYTDNVPFIGMRLLSVFCGTALVPISYLIMKNSGHSTQAAVICGVLITFENALFTQSRFILLDTPMMLFMGYTLLAWINFYNHRNRPFTRGWWTWLVQTGFGLFLSSSVKWVGLFTVATVGLCVLKYLQESRTHLYITTRNFSKQFISLFLCLLVFPFLLYMGLYAIDFQILTNSGSGNSWVSPQFQMTLKNHDVMPVMADIAWESKIHIRHTNTNGGWVHSIPGEYAREGTKDQAIQLVEWDDDLTCWQVLTPEDSIREQYQKNREDRKRETSVLFNGYVYDQDKIRLRHCYTKVALAVHDAASIGSNKSYIREVRGVKWTREPSVETVWRVELVEDGLVPGLADGHRADGNADQPNTATEGTTGRNTHESKQWHSIKGFRLYNEKLNCYLQSHKVFRSPYSTYQEVGCIQGDRQKSNTIFVVDQNVNPHLPATTKSLTYKPLTFFQKFIELNRVMWWTHHDLSSPVHAGEYYSGQTKKRSDESQPWSWPFLNRGLNYFSSKETNNYVYLMGNPLLWWASSIVAITYMFSCIWSVYKYVRGQPASKSERARFGLTPFYAVASGTFFTGWIIHYLPFFFMHRQLYLHHYLPALYFSILLLVSRLDRVLQRWGTRSRYMAGILFMAMMVLSFYSLAPLAYGTDFSSRSRCETIRSLGGWEFVCQRQNLPWARSPPPPPPPSLAKKGVIENQTMDAIIADHPTESVVDAEDDEYDNDHEHEHEHEHLEEHEEEDHEHDHEGPFNEDEKEHYEHEHFHHPQDHHLHHASKQQVKKHLEAVHKQTLAMEAEKRAKKEQEALRLQQQEQERERERKLKEEQQNQQRQQQQHLEKEQGQAEQREKSKEETDAEAAAAAAEKPRGWAVNLARAEAHAEARAIANKEKAELQAAKQALEERQRELELKLMQQEEELKRRQLLHEQHLREKDEKERHEQEHVQQQEQHDVAEAERQRRREQELEQQRNQQEQQQQQEREQEEQRRRQQEQEQAEAEARQRAEEAERQRIAKEHEEEQQRQRQREQEEEERLRREQEEERLRREQEERQEQEYRARRDEEARQEQERIRKAQEEQEEQERQQRLKAEEEAENERRMKDFQDAMQAALAAMGAGIDFGGQYGIAQPPPLGAVPPQVEVQTEAGAGTGAEAAPPVQEEPTREMLEEKLRILQEQIDSQKRQLEER